MVKQHRNVDGLLITAAGRIDQRQFRQNPQPNDGQATHAYDVLHKPDDGRPWHVWETQLSDGARRRVSRHTLRKTAERRAETERLKGPNRRVSPKLAHKLGIV